MNGIEKITQRIAAEAKTECVGVAEEADKRCAAIQAEYEKKAATAYEQALTAGRSETEQSIQREERTVRLEVKKELLGLKQELVSTAFAKARERLLHMPEEQYCAFLARLAGQAATGGEEVILSAADAAKLGAKVVEAANAVLRQNGCKDELKLSNEHRDIACGLVLRKGDIEVNCTVDALLDQSRDELAAQVAGILFE